MHDYTLRRNLFFNATADLRERRHLLLISAVEVFLSFFNYFFSIIENKPTCLHKNGLKLYK